MEYFNVADIFGENVFNDTVMQARLPKKVYKKREPKDPNSVMGRGISEDPIKIKSITKLPKH